MFQMEARLTVAEDVPESPHQSIHTRSAFGKKTIVVQQSFQHSWFAKWPFPHYKETSDSVLSHVLEIV